MSAATDLAALLDRAHRDPRTGCWHWTGHIETAGYPVLYVGKRTVMAHRAVYEAARGPIAPGDVVRRVCHDPETCAGGPTCTHRRCVNPEHLTTAPRVAPLGALMSDVLDRTMITPDGCWLWLGRITNGGYGRIDRQRRGILVHRIAYESAHGPIPEGLVIDHLCHRPASCLGGPSCPHRRCVNPEHLAAVTVSQNAARRSLPPRRTRCGRGHPLTGANRDPRGSCRLCRQIDHRAAYTEGMPVTPDELRDWCRRQGLLVPAHGRIAATLRTAWDEAHPDRPYVPMTTTNKAGGARA